MAGTPSFTGEKSLDEFLKAVVTKVKETQKLASELQGWQHYRDYPGVQRTMEEVESVISSLIGGIFKHQDIKLDLANFKLSDKLEMIREGNDALLERINSDIDEAAGVKKNQDAEFLSSAIKKVQAPITNTQGKNVVLLAARNVQKPQMFFNEKINNSAKEPFVPIIKDKPNSLKPLSVLICLDDTGKEFYSHPYEYELTHWNIPASQMEFVDPIQSRDISETPLQIIENPNDLRNVINDLRKCSEVAVDLEHHSYRSYLGLTCLMQISTRTTDYIVDTIALRGRLADLNEIFTNPKIIKVIHGSDHDVLWLQRDCGLYLVNMFDTHQAAVTLDYPHRSLAALLQRFCNIQANKVYQRADWRIRPLPEEFVQYARQDTHYLLYVYDCLRNELLEKGNNLKNLITAVYERSRELCMKRFEKPFVNRESHMNLYRHSRKTFNSRQMFALRELYLWRDKVAREQDESEEYVLPKHMMLQIAEVLPKEMQGILACCNPIPPLVKTALLALHTIIREAREQPLLEIKALNLVQKLSTNESLHTDLNQSLTCRHDLSQCDENPRNLPCLINIKATLESTSTSPSSSSSNLPIMDSSKLLGISYNDRMKALIYSRLPDNRFMSPYERYVAYQEIKEQLEGGKTSTNVNEQDVERVNKVKAMFLTLTNNTPEEQKEISREAGNHEVGELTQVLAEGSMLHFDSDEEQEKQEQTGQKKKKKQDARYQRVVMNEEIKKARNESEKRKSNETEMDNDESPPKVQKTGSEETDKPNNTAEEMQDMNNSQETVEEGTENISEDGIVTGFNYDEADFSIFQKAERKLKESRQKVKETFKGKNSRSHRGKSSMKSFTWGGNSGNKRKN